jgi:hypothetical protein
MVQIPQYFRGKLESSQTGVPSLDHSGAIIAQSVQGLADTFFKGVVQLETAQNKILNDSRQSKLLGEYTTKVMEGTDKIRRQYLNEPEKGVEELQTFRTDLRNDYMSQVEDGGFKLGFSAEIDKLDMQAKVDDTSWKIKQSSIVSQQNYISKINEDARYLTKGSYEDFLTKATGLLNDKNGITQAYGDIAQGTKIVNEGLKSYTQGFIYGQLERGNSFEMAQMLANGKFDPFITPEDKADLKTKSKDL